MDFLHISEIFSRIGEIQQRFQFDFGMPAAPFENMLNNAMAKNAQNATAGMVPPSIESVEIQSALKNSGLTGQGKSAMLPLEMKEKSLASLFPVEQAAPAQTPPGALGVNLEDLIAGIAQSNNLEPSLVKAIVSAESNFNPKAISNKGALGLMQLMPDTAKSLGVINPFNPEENVTGGVTYFKQLLSQFSGDLPLALAAYNAGPGAVKQHGGIPPFNETQNFVNKVLSLKKQYEQQ